MPEPNETKKNKNIIKKIIPAATRSNYKNKKEIIKQLKAEIQHLKKQLRDSRSESSDLLENLGLAQESSENWEENFLRANGRNRNLTAEANLLTQRTRELERALNDSRRRERERERERERRFWARISPNWGKLTTGATN